MVLTLGITGGSQTYFSCTWGGGQQFFQSFIRVKVYLNLNHHMIKKASLPSYNVTPKMKIFFALLAKSPFLKIYIIQIFLLNNPFIILFTYCLLYILLHMYILFHHPIEKLELQTSWGGGQSFFLIPEGGVEHYFWLFKGGSGIFSHVLRWSTICCLVP